MLSPSGLIKRKIWICTLIPTTALARYHKKATSLKTTDNSRKILLFASMENLLNYAEPAVSGCVPDVRLKKNLALYCSK